MKYIGVLFFLACLVFSFQVSDPYTIPKLVLLCLVCCLLTQGGRLPQNAFEGVRALWFLWPVCIPVWPIDVVTGIQARGVCLFYLLACWLVVPVATDHKRALALGMGWAGIATSIYAILQRAGIDFLSLEPANQAVGFMGNPNFNAHFLLLAWMLAKFSTRNWEWFAKTLFSLAIVLSASRASIMVWLFYLLMALWQSPKFSRKWVWLILLGGIAVVGWTVRDGRVLFHYLRNPGIYAEEFSNQPRLIAERDPWFRGKRLSIMARVALYANSTALILDAPLAGIGPGQFRSAYPRVSREKVPDMLFGDQYRSETAHNLFLDAAIAFGIPWLILGLWLLYLQFARLEKGAFALAVAGQMALSLVSLNYLNPVIVTSLILLQPHRIQPPPGQREAFYWQRLLWLLPLAMVFVPAWRIALAEREWDWRKIPNGLPAQKARAAYQEGELGIAWRSQMRALANDPWGPDTLFNTGVMAWELGRNGAEDGYHYAIWVFLLIEDLYPNFSQVQDRIVEFQNAGLWQPEWAQLVSPPTTQADLEQWRREVFLWQPASGNSPQD